MQATGGNLARATVLRRCLVGCAAVLLASGCKRGRQEEPPRASGEKSRSFFARLMEPAAPAGYAWDGQSSRVTASLSVEAAYHRALEVLQAMNFTINENETRRQPTGARIVALSPSKTIAQLQLDGKGPGETEIRAKVGATGDRGGSERILDEILKVPRPAPAKKKQ